jgi:hypothetical protein
MIKILIKKKKILLLSIILTGIYILTIYKNNNPSTFYATDFSATYYNTKIIQKCGQDLQVEIMSKPNSTINQGSNNKIRDFIYFLNYLPSNRSNDEKYKMVYGMESVIFLFVFVFMFTQKFKIQSIDLKLMKRFKAQAHFFFELLYISETHFFKTELKSF